MPHGLAWPVYIILIPIELMGLFVKPFALTMRLAANMTGGHIAILALLSLMAIIGEMFASAYWNWCWVYISSYGSCHLWTRNYRSTCSGIRFYTFNSRVRWHGN